MKSTKVDQYKEVLEGILAAKGLPADDLTAESNLFLDIGLDSIVLIEFLVELDARLDLGIDFEALEYDDLVSLTNLELALSRDA